MRSHDLYIFSLFLGALNVPRGKTCFSQLEGAIARGGDHCTMRKLQKRGLKWSTLTNKFSTNFHKKNSQIFNDDVKLSQYLKN